MSLWSLVAKIGLVAAENEQPRSNKRLWWTRSDASALSKLNSWRLLKLIKIKSARSRLYRSRILQVNTRWKALAEIYTMHSFAPLSNLKIFVKNRWIVCCFFSFFPFLFPFFLEVARPQVETEGMPLPQPPGSADQKRRFSRKRWWKRKRKWTKSSLPSCKNVVNISALQKMP